MKLAASRAAFAEVAPTRSIRPGPRLQQQASFETCRHGKEPLIRRSGRLMEVSKGRGGATRGPLGDQVRLCSHSKERVSSGGGDDEEL